MRRGSRRWCAATARAAISATRPVLAEVVTMIAVMMAEPATKRSSSQTASMLNALVRWSPAVVSEPRPCASLLPWVAQSGRPR